MKTAKASVKVNNNAKKAPQQKLKSSKNNSIAVARPVVSAVGNPVMRATADGCVITHRELVDTIEISSSETSNITSYSLNPGISSPFRWLSTIANSYETYRFKKLKFEYVPFVSAMTPGSISMAIDYDAIDLAPTQRSDLMSFAGAVTSQIWSPLELISSKDRMDKLPNRWTRSGLITPTTGDIDLKTYDVGNLYVMTVTGTVSGDSLTVGDIFVSYEIELKTPQVPSFGEGLIVNGPSVDVNKPFGGNVQAKGKLPLAITANSNIFKFVTPWVGNVSLFLRGTISSGLPAVLPSVTMTVPDGAHPGDNKVTVANWVTGTDSLGAPSVLLNLICAISDPKVQVAIGTIGQLVQLASMRLSSAKNYDSFF